MKTEIYRKEIYSQSVDIRASAIESLRVTDSSFVTVRVFDGGKVGISGKVGKADERQLKIAAEENLAVGIRYPEPDAVESKSDDCGGLPVANDKFLDVCRGITERLSERHPDFLLSNNIKQTAVQNEYETDGGKLFSCGGDFEMSLVLKEKKSANIMDVIVGGTLDAPDEEGILSYANLLLTAYARSAKAEKGLPVIISDPSAMLAQDLDAQTYAGGGGRLGGKLDKKVFSENYSLTAERGRRNGYIPFFDAEGTARESVDLISGGVFTDFISNRYTASLVGKRSSGCAVSSHITVPSAAFYACDVHAAVTHGSIRELIPNKAVYAFITSGGDMTATGDFGIPVQLAYLMEYGVPVAKLPPLMLSGNIFRALGEDYLGCADDGSVFHDRLTAFNCSYAEL